MLANGSPAPLSSVQYTKVRGTAAAAGFCSRIGWV